MTKKRIIVVALVCAFAAGTICLINIFFATHTLNFELVDEIKCENGLSGLGDKYFFIKDSDFCGFYDGEEFLRNCVPDYDTSTLNTHEYTYLAAVDGKVNLVIYSGRKCLKRTFFALPDEYAADIDCTETNDNMLRIYRMKKINIDYDYHSS